jgi:pterin-4a-carbinolamine dehydratase
MRIAALTSSDSSVLLQLVLLSRKDIALATKMDALADEILPKTSAAS